MNPEQDVIAALRALADADRGAEAGPRVETKLRAAFHARVRRRRLARIAVWSMAAAALLVAMLVLRKNEAPREEKARVAPVAEPQTFVHSITPYAAGVAAAPVARKARRMSPARPQEIVTDFFPLVDSAPPVERGELVRVNVSAAAMQAVGLPVREDRLQERVQADVLVSEEGLATAIRFVKYSQ
jgi:hypothetical protein